LSPNASELTPPESTPRSVIVGCATAEAAVSETMSDHRKVEVFISLALSYSKRCDETVTGFVTPISAFASVLFEGGRGFGPWLVKGSGQS
jgi:hypothetical protein